MRFSKIAEAKARNPSLCAGAAALALALAISGTSLGAAAAATPNTAAGPVTSKLAHTDGIALTGVKNPKTTLANAKIEDQAGVPVGVVQEVIVDAKGRPIELKVDVGSYLGMTYKLVSMKASVFKFDTGSKTLVTSLTKSQIHVIAGG
jgi:hypothetical protein